MQTMFVISAVAEVLGQAFRRLGQDWPKAGRQVARSDFTDAEWNTLSSEPMLHISPAPEGAEAAREEAGLREAVKVALGKLAPTDFDELGAPKISAVKKAVPGQTKALTPALVAEVWAQLKGV